MPDREDRTTETERLAGTVNDTLEFIADTIGCLIRSCLWLILGFVGFAVAFVAVATPFTILEERLGFIPTVLVFGLVGWIAVYLYRRSRSGGGGGST